MRSGLGFEEGDALRCRMKALTEDSLEEKEKTVIGGEKKEEKKGLFSGWEDLSVFDTQENDPETREKSGNKTKLKMAQGLRRRRRRWVN